MVAIRCIISIVVDEDTVVADPPGPVSDMDVMSMEKASIQSAGASPMLISTAVVPEGVGVGVGPPLLNEEPEHPAMRMEETATKNPRTTVAALTLRVTNLLQAISPPLLKPGTSEAWLAVSCVPAHKTAFSLEWKESPEQ
jgi:hypothetical protein